MNILLKKSDYVDMKTCCDTSLFEKGAGVPGSARDEWALNDFGYLEGFPIQWKFVGGFEAPMAVYSYDQLWVGSSGELQPLESNGKEKYRDGLTHFPVSPDLKWFVATTAERKRGSRLGHILIYDLSQNCKLARRITYTEYSRPIQFVDKTRLLVLRENGLYVLSVISGEFSPLFKTENWVYTNAHLSSDRSCACAVRSKNIESEPSGVTIHNLEHAVTDLLNFGENPNVHDKSTWLLGCTIPIRVHNGMVNLVVENAA